MRDPKRIRRILDKIGEYWEEYPDLRLGQILVNFAPLQFKSDIFYWEDEDLEKTLDIRLDNSYKNRYDTKY